MVFGAVFPSAVKPDAPRASIELLARARQSLRIPVVAIGGINADNAGAVVRSGVDAIAVISGLYNHSDPQAAAREPAALITPRPLT